MTATALDSSPRTGNFLDLLPTGAMVIDSDLVIEEWNRTLVEWTGVTKEEAIGSTLTQLYPNVGHSRYLERLLQVFESGFPATYSAAFHKHFLPVPARHGLECEWMIQQTDVRRLPESRDHALITLQDVSLQYVQLARLKKERVDLVNAKTELAKANEELIERNKELDDFTRIASHDLKAPLRRITSFGEMLAEQLGDELDDDSREYLGYMQDSASRMKTLIQDLMTLSRASLTESRREEVSLSEIVQDAMSLLAVALQEEQATIEVDQLPTVCGDYRLLSQLFQNLIGNALKFRSDEPLHIHVTCEHQAEEIIFGVRDNGIGILENQLKRIFQPFVKLHSSDVYEGSGFGLSICQKAIVKHGGRIWVESQPGKGAHFRFTIPDETLAVSC